MSPEQLRGDSVEYSWDLWAIGLLSYEMLTGAHPFAGTRTAHTPALVLAGRMTPVAAHVPEAPPAWQQLFDRTFSLELERRPKTAAELLEAFEQALA